MSTNDPLDVEAGDVEPPASTVSGATVGRRGLVGGLALSGVALGAGAAGGVVGSRSGMSSRRQTLAIEVACLGPTMRNTDPSNKADDGDFRNAFMVEGLLFPQGTILGDGFIPVEDRSIGRWICRGWFINDSARPQPHISSTQDYVFARISAEQPFARDLITSAGIEGTDKRNVVWYRAVTGGTGKYFGAIGEHAQSFFAENATTFSDGFAAPCFRVEFDLLLPD